MIEAVVRESLAAIDQQIESALERTSRRVVLAIGKAAPRMARAIGRGDVIVTTDHTDALGCDVIRAAHPIPDERSVHAAAALLDAARGNDVIALVSGGASSLACAPATGVSLDEKRHIARVLLESGAPITDVNLVRRHLSRIKGGGLAAVARSTRAFIVSDVIGGSATDVGSGPASAAPDDVDDARAVLSRHGLASFAARMVPSPRVNATSTIIARPEDLAEAAAAALRARGYAVTILPPTLAAADDVAREYLRPLSPCTALVRVAEPSVTLPPHHGRGGRAGRVALLAWTAGLAPGVTLACVASDGVDGSSGAAGAIVRGKIDGADALAAYDDASFLRAHGAAIDLGPTGHNLCDLHVLLAE
jgi:glycerate 2-kinase